MNLEDIQMSNDVLERHLQHLSSEAAAQAVVTMHADVEWRHMCALTTAWEIHACEQHLKFLHMVLEDEGETYANASLESLCTSMKELVRSPKKGIEDSISLGVTAYSHDVTSFAVGDAQLDFLKSAAHMCFPTLERYSLDSVSSGDSSEDSNGGQDPKSHMCSTLQFMPQACVPLLNWYHAQNGIRMLRHHVAVSPQTLTDGNNLECLLGHSSKWGQNKADYKKSWSLSASACQWGLMVHNVTLTMMSNLPLPADSDWSWQNQYHGSSSGYNDQIVHVNLPQPEIEPINPDLDVHDNHVAGHYDCGPGYGNTKTVVSDPQVDYYGYGSDYLTWNDHDGGRLDPFSGYHPIQTDQQLSMGQPNLGSFTSHNLGCHGCFQDSAVDHGYTFDCHLEQAHSSSCSIGTQDWDRQFLGQLNPSSQHGGHTDGRYINPSNLNVQLEPGRYVSQPEQQLPTAAWVTSTLLPVVIASIITIFPKPTTSTIQISNMHTQHMQQSMLQHQSLPQGGLGYYGHPPYHHNVTEVQQVPASCSHTGYSLLQVNNVNCSNPQPKHGHYDPQPKQQHVVQSLPSDDLEHHDCSQFPVADGDQQSIGSSHTVIKFSLDLVPTQRRNGRQLLPQPATIWIST
ncbi:uncharacterized protein BJ212DRAFT_1299142 [Suillus subaureus]|uniref:Uncharacterized protein n=1 Tax=Suillus subaureus TaxID=48587 RepID=A0A9P7ED41_9AGAM|nr:uncharacterized protein BJ212DRAFT_1299142 [Suillus subaureus]KAG1817605.1 hypothetical protein BJ212DRAFT_1299142 [Suillus subaureus]